MNFEKLNNYFNIFSDHEIISFHLNMLHQLDENITIFSSLTAALRDARQNTGRNLETGEDLNLTNNEKSGNWLGAIGYLIILDQIGKCYKPKGPIQYKNLSPIQRSLKYFTTLSDLEINAIYALRNAFAHDYSISNPNTKYVSYQHQFTLLGFRSRKIVRLPKKQWNGFSDNKTKENMTIISLPSLGDLIEGVVKKVIDYHKKSSLEILLKGGVKEIKVRYLQYSYNEKNNQ